MTVESSKRPAKSDHLFTSLLARSWFIRLSVASCLIAVLWAMILWAVSLA
jgi:hypothetical protein